MKILLCERSLKGHRKTYLKWLLNIPDLEFIIYAPEIIDDKHSYFIYNNNGKRGLFEYLTWISEIRNIIFKHNINIIHILDGDSIMKYMGIGLNNLDVSKIIITYHHFFTGYLRTLSYRLMNQRKNIKSIVHTKVIKDELINIGVKNVFQCNYPAFNFNKIDRLKESDCKRDFDLPNSIPIIGIVGGITSYKNIVNFLNIISKSNYDFHIFIAGKICDVPEKLLKDAILPIANKVTCVFGRLSEDEYYKAIMASDIIYCIYDEEFNGASGPLTDGVCAKKMILSSNHGSLGDITRFNSLGIVADCKDAKDILKKVEIALTIINSFNYSEKAEVFRETLKPNYFCRRYKEIYCKD